MCISACPHSFGQGEGVETWLDGCMVSWWLVGSEALVLHACEGWRVGIKYFVVRIGGQKSLGARVLLCV